MLTIPGYYDPELLYEGSKSTIIRAKRDTDNLAVIIKQVSSNARVEDNISRLRYEYRLLRDLKIPGAIRPLSYQSSEDQLYTVFYDEGGEPLSRVIQQQPQDWRQYLPLMRDLCELLSNVHQCGIIHKQITPDNIIFNPQSGRLQLIDFTLATKLESEQIQPESAHLPEGSLPYMAPEQSGRINRKIDYRTDFYSLGITFYQLLTGSPPFTSEDKLELIHSHIAKHPPPPHEINPQVPPPLSAIILKLLAKDAEQRYQSAFGILSDLGECIRQLEQNNELSPFEIARQDCPERFLIPQRLYGREHTINRLLKSYRKSALGEQQVVLISGYAGMGKSSLVNEIREAIIEQNGLFISGKFDQFSRSHPYSAVIYALQSLIRQLLTESEERIHQWRTRLQEALGDNIFLMTRMIPELELILSQPTTPQRLPKYQEQNLISRLFVRLMEVFARSERPLVMFLDDLQWGDIASLNIINTLTGSSTLPGMMLILSYRDQEIGPTHPARKLLEQATDDNSRMQEIKLGPLKLEQIGELLADTLHRSPGDVSSLASICLHKTQGNPFFLKQFLTTLYHKRKIFFRQGQWHWDEAGIDAQEMADDVITLLVSRIEELPSETQRVLKLAACIGSRFNLKTVSLVCAQASTSSAQALWPGLSGGLIIPLEEHYSMSSANCNEEAWYRFVHDRVQQAAYSLVAPEERKALHLQIGRLLTQNQRNTEHDSSIFEIANHLNLAREIIRDPDERIKLAELNLSAGLKARQSAAYEGSAEYFQNGLDLLTDASWRTDYPLTLTLHTEAAEIAFSRSDYARMEQLINEVLSHAHTLTDRLRIHELQIQAETARNRFDQALKIALEVLTALGIRFPESPGRAQIKATLLKTQWKLKRVTHDTLLSAPEIESERVRAALPILTSMFGIVKFSSSSLRPLVMAKQLELTLKHGLMPCSAQSFAGYGGMLCGYYGDIDKGYELGQLALRLDQRLPSRITHHKTLFLHHTYIAHWKEPLAHTLQPLLDAHHLALDCGDVEWGAYALASYIQYAFFLGERLQPLQQRLLEYLHQIRLSGQKQSEEYSLFTLQTIDNLRGRCTAPTILEGEYYRESSMLDQHNRNNHKTAVCLHYFYKGLMHYLYGEYTLAVTACRSGLEYLEYISGTFTSPYFRYLSALSELALMDQQSLVQSAINRRKVISHLKKVEQFAAYSPANHKHHVLLLRAELYRISGQRLLAMSFYESAIAAAEKSDFILDRAMCYEITGRFYLSWGKRTLAESNLQTAWSHYRDWGARSKCEQMIRHYRYDFSGKTEGASETAAEPADLHPPSTISNINLDIASVLKAAHTIADEIVLDRILDRLMSLAMENAGAQRSTLILTKDQQLHVAADTDTNGHQQIEPGTQIQQCSDRLPVTLIQYVSRTHRTVATDSSREDEVLLQDNYLRQKPPCSILCLPLLYHGELTGLLYLENNEARSVFTPQRVDTLKVLAAQAAISIETAKLYRSLEQSEQEYRSLVENAVEGIFRVSPRGQFISVNPALVKLLGHSTQEEFLNRVTDIRTQCFCYPGDMNKILILLNIQPQVSEFETQLLRCDGERVHVSISARRVLNDKGNPLYYEGTITDISARKAREQAEQDRIMAEMARQKAEAETAAKSQFLATMSHEIRTPMNGILGMAQLLLNDQLSTRQKNQVRAIYHSGHSLLEILNSILDYSKLEAGKLEFSSTPFSIKQTAIKLQDLVQPLIQEKGLKFTLKQTGPLPDQMLGDERALHQILLNLCSNAIKFTPTGTITLQITPLRKQADHLTVRFQVEDDGIGIPHHAQNRIFQEFSQADSSITRHFGGTGLGLAICRNLVEQQGGRIGFESEPGKGSLFWFELSYEITHNVIAMPKPRASCDLLPLRILLVEDTPINQEVTAGLLRQDQHRVDIAEDGFAALELIKQNAYDLILMDIHLPRMDGMQTTRRIRQLSDQTRAATPVIALTASITDEEVQQYHRAGMNNVAGKPILYSELKKRIAETLSEQSDCSAPRAERDQNQSPLLNHALLNEHISLLGAPQFAGLIDTYYRQANELFEGIRLAVQERQSEDARQLTHKLAGASGNFGFESFRKALLNIESSLKRGEMNSLGTQLDEAQKIFRHTREHLESHIDQRSG